MSVRLYGFDLKLSVQGRARLAERGMAVGSSDPHVALTAADIPGADLAAPFDKHTVPALRWWLLCRGICAPGSWNKKKLIDRINEAVVDNMTVVDVDGSYLYKKYKTLTDAGHVLAPLTAPPPPPSGWVTVSSENYTQVAPDIPTVTVGDEGAFRALTRGYAHWASGRLEKLSVNTNNPKYCHIRAAMKPSMKTGVYHAYLLLESDAEGLASILAATCECVAGKSLSCTHVSAILHALTAIKPTSFNPKSGISLSGGEEQLPEEQPLPVTSYLCKWNVPRSRKESTIPMSEAVFEKHEYSKQTKRKIKLVEDYDPRPPQF
ncbi:hypothetical protein EMCRGX_G014558 [Ephydatia muelleri]